MNAADLIAAIRDCPECASNPYLSCPTHDAQLAELFGPCDDPDCPTCAHDNRDYHV